MIRILPLAILLFVAGLMVTVFQPDAEGCAASGRPGDSIRIAEERAIIVWDPVKKIEHFIRRATFDTKSPDFGFLVPTPAVPILKEVEDAVFRKMDRWIVPETVERNRYHFEPISGCWGRDHGSKSDRRAGSAPDSGVRVLGEQEVGGFKTAILDADNTDDLSQWLKDNGYSFDPELQSWLAPYVAAKWKVTAFKIMQDPKTGKPATTRPVRMSFATDKPFFPYREPEGKDDKQKQGARLLRVFFVSSERMEGKLGNAVWHAEVPWSDQLTDEQRITLVRETGVPADEIPARVWMTTFEDRASPRPGKEEVYFEPAPERAPIRPPPIIIYSDIWIPIDVVLAGILFVFLMGLAFKRVGLKAILPSGIPPGRDPRKGTLPPPWSAS